MSKTVDPLWLSQKISHPTLQEITAQTVALIHSGEIPIGAKLPPVRQFAEVLGVGPSTISAAWKTLRQHNMVTGQGKQGITVNDPLNLTVPLSFSNFNQTMADKPLLDLTYSVADPALLPHFHQAMDYAVNSKELNQHLRSPITPRLKEAALPTWPYKTDAFMAFHEGCEAFDILLKTSQLVGSSIAIEQPYLINCFDILKQYQVTLLPVECDNDGPIVDSLSKALAQKPVAFLYQPRNHWVTGHSVTAERAKQLAPLFKTNAVRIIEYELLSAEPPKRPVSLGEFYPKRTVYIRSYAKTYGSDLPLAVLSADRQLVEQMQNIRSLSIGWTSRLLQNALAWLIQDPETQRQLKVTRRTYLQRHNQLIDALRIRGINVIKSRTGHNLWLKVPSEQHAVETMSKQGIVVLAGKHFGAQGDYIRISTAQLDSEQIPFVANSIKLIYRIPTKRVRWQGV